MAGLRGELRGEMVGLRGEMYQGFTEVYEAMNALTWKLLGGIAVIMTVITAVGNWVG